MRKSPRRKKSPSTLPSLPRAQFGWQGFSLELPEDFAPVALSGQVESGYARLDDGERCTIQVRWLPTASEDCLAEAVDRYLRKAKSGVRPVISGSRYRLGERRGVWLVREGRGFILESSGPAPSGRALTMAAESLTVHRDPWPWCLLGLDVRLPHQASLVRHELLAGRTRLEFKLPRLGGHLTAERWGFASQLLAEKTLGEWASAVFRWKGEIEVDSQVRCRLVHRQQCVFLQVDPDHDRIQVLSASARRIEWRPRWEWFGSD